MGQQNIKLLADTLPGLGMFLYLLKIDVLRQILVSNFWAWPVWSSGVKVTDWYSAPSVEVTTQLVHGTAQYT